MTIIILLVVLLLLGAAAAAATPFALSGCLAHVQALVVAVHGLAAVAVVVATHVVLFPLGRSHFRRMTLAPFGATILKPNLQKSQIEMGNFRLWCICVCGKAIKVLNKRNTNFRM